jgi:rubrerythrin
MADTSSKLVKAILETIREQAEYALKQLQAAEEGRSMVWLCRECGYTKHFTRPVLANVAAPCPKCRCEIFEPSGG